MTGRAVERKNHVDVDRPRTAVVTWSDVHAVETDGNLGCGV
ncbi:MAG: hypothetical protein ACFCVK_09570 [Acidimicrobiales bacterium]